MSHEEQLISGFFIEQMIQAVAHTCFCSTQRVKMLDEAFNWLEPSANISENLAAQRWN